MIEDDFSNALDYESFQRNNLKKVNRSLNRILWLTTLTGPALALGRYGQIFKNVSYASCIRVSLIMLIVAAINHLIMKKDPYSYLPGLFALVAEDLLLLYMNISHISIRLTWAMMPVLSLLYCNTNIYVYVSIMNYLIMGVATWLEAPHYAAIRTDFPSPLMAFVNIFSGCTIEAFLIFLTGYAISMATLSYFRKMMDQYAQAQKHQEETGEQLHILTAMAEIYDYVNLISFSESTEMSLRSEKLHKIPIASGQDHTHLVQSIKDKVIPEMIDAFWEFTNITTVPERLIGRNAISGEFISSEIGWFRAQYIRIQGEINEKPTVVIYTIQSIDDDKRREEKLILISRTDELTRLFNRRCYEEDIQEIKEKGVDPRLAIISADLNGLKTTNDNKGHAAGDELIKAAASCLKYGVGNYGKAYRTGGDEFICIVYCDDIDPILENIRDNIRHWHGNLIDEVSISIGYAQAKDHHGLPIEELEKIADEAMYKEKENYYKQPTHNRRNTRN